MSARAWNGGEAKRCSCGRHYDEAGFAALEYVGELDDTVDVLEIRNCPACHSSIAVFLRPSVPDTLPAPAEACP